MNIAWMVIESRFVEQLMWKLRTAVILCLAMQTFVLPALLFRYIELLHEFAPRRQECDTSRSLCSLSDH